MDDHVAEEDAVKELGPVGSHMLKHINYSAVTFTNRFEYRCPAGKISLGIVGVDCLVHSTKLIRLVAWHLWGEITLNICNGTLFWSISLSFPILLIWLAVHAIMVFLFFVVGFLKNSAVSIFHKLTQLEKPSCQQMMPTPQKPKQNHKEMVNVNIDYSVHRGKAKVFHWQARAILTRLAKEGKLGQRRHVSAFVTSKEQNCCFMFHLHRI